VIATKYGDPFTLGFYACKKKWHSCPALRLKFLPFWYRSVPLKKWKLPELNVVLMPEDEIRI